MGAITERSDAAGGYEAVGLALVRGAAPGQSGVMLRRRSPRPTRRAVLHLQCPGDSFVPDDLVSWYTERGFHCYVADLRRPGDLDRRGGSRRGMRGRADCLAGLDAACQHLREEEGIDSIILSAHGAGALIAALWCAAARPGRSADVLILSSPSFGRQLRRGLDIACPVLVMCPAAEWDAQGGPGGRPARRRRRGAPATTRLGAHVTWLRIDDGRDCGAATGSVSRRRFFDEMGRWLGAYMYGQLRDQLL
jgi:Serine aminopeptidase, S33